MSFLQDTMNIRIIIATLCVLITGIVVFSVYYSAFNFELWQPITDGRVSHEEFLCVEQKQESARPKSSFESFDCQSLGYSKRKEPAKIVDAIIFNGEAEMVLMRWFEYSDLVDYLVVAESGESFSRQRKPMTFHAVRQSIFGTILPSTEERKIVYIANEKVSGGNDSWSVEKWQREVLVEGLRGLKDLQPDDPVIFTDTDEIPRREIVERFKYCYIDTPATISMSLFYYHFGWAGNRWDAARIVSYKEIETQASIDRRIRPPVEPKTEFLESGWHASYFLDTEFIISKLEQFSHQEFNTEYYKDPDRINRCIREGIDLFERSVNVLQKYDEAIEREWSRMPLLFRKHCFLIRKFLPPRWRECTLMVQGDI